MERETGRDRWQKTIEQERTVDRELDEIKRLARSLVQASLLLSGYHPHKGQWRRSRE